MTYRIIWKKQTKKQFAKISADITKRIIKATETKLTKNPQAGKLLSGNLKGVRSLRIGAYRVMYHIHDETITIYIIHVGHRKKVYEK